MKLITALATLILVATPVFAQTEMEQLDQRLNNIDAEINQERNEAILTPFEADEMHGEVGQIRSQEYSGTSDISVLNEQATAVEERLYPPH